MQAVIFCGVGWRAVSHSEYSRKVVSQNQVQHVVLECRFHDVLSEMVLIQEAEEIQTGRVTLCVFAYTI